MQCCFCLCILQALIEKLKSQLDAARRAKESYAARKKTQQDTTKTNKVFD